MHEGGLWLQQACLLLKSCLKHCALQGCAPPDPWRTLLAGSSSSSCGLLEELQKQLQGLLPAACPVACCWLACWVSDLLAGGCWQADCVAVKRCLGLTPKVQHLLRQQQQH